MALKRRTMTRRLCRLRQPHAGVEIRSRERTSGAGATEQAGCARTGGEIAGSRRCLLPPGGGAAEWRPPRTERRRQSLRRHLSRPWRPAHCRSGGTPVMNGPEPAFDGSGRASRRHRGNHEAVRVPAPAVPPPMASRRTDSATERCLERSSSRRLCEASASARITARRSRVCQVWTCWCWCGLAYAGAVGRLCLRIMRAVPRTQAGCPQIPIELLFRMSRSIRASVLQSRRLCVQSGLCVGCSPPVYYWQARLPLSRTTRLPRAALPMPSISCAQRRTSKAAIRRTRSRSCGERARRSPLVSSKKRTSRTQAPASL